MKPKDYLSVNCNNAIIFLALALQSLTSEERLFINQFKKDIEAVEKTIWLFSIH